MFEGNRVGFLYPLEDGTRPGAIKGPVIFISADDNGGNGKYKIGAVGPAPAAAFPGCKPGPTPFADTEGHTRVDSDSGSHD